MHYRKSMQVWGEKHFSNSCSQKEENLMSHTSILNSPFQQQQTVWEVITLHSPLYVGYYSQ